MLNKYWIQGLDLDNDYLEELLKNDKKYMCLFNLSIQAIKKGRCKNPRLKILSVKKEFYESFLCEFLKRKHTIIKIKNKLIMDVFEKKNKRTKKIEYDKLIKDLDLLLNVGQPKPKPIPLIISSCNCRQIGFGLCFCPTPSPCVLK